MRAKYKIIPYYLDVLGPVCIGNGLKNRPQSGTFPPCQVILTIACSGSRSLSGRCHRCCQCCLPLMCLPSSPGIPLIVIGSLTVIPGGLPVPIHLHSPTCASTLLAPCPSMPYRCLLQHCSLQSAQGAHRLLLQLYTRRVICADSSLHRLDFPANNPTAGR